MIQSGSRGLRLLLLLNGFFLGACGHPRPNTTAGPVVEPQVRRIPSVPFFSDSTDQCGPSSLASVLTFWNRPTEPAELRDEIYIERLGGTLPMDLLPAVQSRGLKAEVYEGDLSDLKSQIAAGNPLVAYLNLGYSFYPAGHYVVVTGYDDNRRGVYAHSGKEKNSFIPYRRFLKHWNKTDRWTLRIQSSEVGAP